MQCYVNRVKGAHRYDEIIAVLYKWPKLRKVWAV